MQEVFDTQAPPEQTLSSKEALELRDTNLIYNELAPFLNNELPFFHAEGGRAYRELDASGWIKDGDGHMLRVLEEFHELGCSGGSFPFMLAIVRRLLMFMEEVISESSRFVVFEPNPQTWRAIGRLINPFLQDIKDKGGLYDFAFQCDEETNTPAVIDRNEMVARVFVKPTKTAEFIELNFILTSTQRFLRILIGSK